MLNDSFLISPLVRDWLQQYSAWFGVKTLPGLTKMIRLLSRFAHGQKTAKTVKEILYEFSVSLRELLSCGKFLHRFVIIGV